MRDRRQVGRLTKIEVGMGENAVNERDSIAYPFHLAHGGHSNASGQVMQAYVSGDQGDGARGRVEPTGVGGR